MGVVNTKSTAITNDDATPKVLNQRALVRGPLYVALGTVEVAAADSDTSTFRMCRVPSNAIITNIVVSCDAITGGTSYDLGIYKTADDGGAVVDVDAFASAVDLSSALQATNIRFESASNAGDVANIEKRLWENSGFGTSYSTDPNTLFDIVFTANTVGSGAGTISLRVEYTC